jgi:hypothetical protein
MSVRIHNRKSFMQALNELWKRGGAFQKAADTVYSVLGRIDADEHGLDPFRGLRRTEHGESRIRNCVKYDLEGRCRLVTVQCNGLCFLLFCGNHEECDKWLKDNRGWEPIVTGGNRAIETFRSSSEEETDRVIGSNGHFAGQLYERLPEPMYEKLVEGVSRKVSRSLEQVDVTTTEGELWEIVSHISEPDRRLAVHDVFAMLRDDRVVPAIARIELFLGAVASLLDMAPEVLPDIVDTDVIRRIDPQSPQYLHALRRFMMTARYRDWMTFMHPDQERIAQETFDGPAKLVGVSGSGKTCVVVQRAIKLATVYASGRILVLTLNKALAGLIDDLVTACAEEETRSRIDVKPFFAMCRDLMLTIDPKGARRYDEVTWKANEHVDEIWQEYYRCENNNHDAAVFREVHDSLLSRGWNAEKYLREEVDWVRSLAPLQERARYLQINRKGRTVPLSPRFRERVLQGTKGWEEKMEVVGVVDLLGLAQKLAQHRNLIPPTYRCVLVDEVQDFGTLELGIVRAIVPPRADDLFLCGDAAQAVTTKHQSFADAGIVVSPARSRTLSQNYRNSRDVLEAAHEVLFRNMSEELLDREDITILDPEYSTFHATAPLLLEGGSLEEEIQGALSLANEKLSSMHNGKVCLALCGYTLLEIARFGTRIDVPVLDGSRRIDDESLFLSDLENTKGFEFDLLCILNCSADVMPDSAAPAEERFRELARLYVALTRAKTDLIVSWSGAPSPFVQDAKSKFWAAHWSDYVSLDLAGRRGKPQKLETYRDGATMQLWRNMKADDFLVSGLALGITVELSSKLRELVDGKGLRRGGEMLRWRSIGEAVDAVRTDVRARRVWGPEIARQFLALAERLSGMESTAGT